MVSKFKVKIIGATSGCYWYADKVGEVFEVKDLESKHGYEVVDMEDTRWIGKEDCVVVIEERPVQSKPIDAHYSFDYVLTGADKEAGKIKVDPYFVGKTWKLGSKDDSGVLFHCLKTLARFGDKNSREREIVALYKQVKRLAEIENVKLD